MPLAHIQQTLQESLAGCQGLRADRLHHKISAATTPTQLWDLRAELHQCIAQAQSESLATARINGLIDVFSGWVPAAQLVNIRPDFKPSQK